MSEWRGEVVAPWLKRELGRSLSPVAAPESLWDRIEERQCAARPGRSIYWTLWPVAAAVMLTAAGSAAAWRIGSSHDSIAGLKELALRELKALREGRARLDFRSGDPSEIRMWVKTNADIDIDLPLRPAPVQLLGARVIRQEEKPVAEIAYLAGGGVATLLVAGRRPGRDGDEVKSAHLFRKLEPDSAGPVYSWKTREQEYLLASTNAREPQAACRLCHEAHVTVN